MNCVHGDRPRLKTKTLAVFMVVIMIFTLFPMNFVYAESANQNKKSHVKSMDHPQEPGEVKTYKDAEINRDGKSMDVTLRVEAQQKENDNGVDYIMVVDGSGSMDWGKVNNSIPSDPSKSRMSYAIMAQRHLENKHIKGHPENRIATVLYGSTAEKYMVGKGNKKIYFAGDKTKGAKEKCNVPGTGCIDSESLEAWIKAKRDYRDENYIGQKTDGVDYGIGTNTQAGLHAATEIIREDIKNNPSNKNRKKVVILLSDGMPTHYPTLDIKDLDETRKIDKNIGIKYGIKALPGKDMTKYHSYRYYYGTTGYRDSFQGPIDNALSANHGPGYSEYICRTNEEGMFVGKDDYIQTPKQSVVEKFTIDSNQILNNCLADGQLMVPVTITPKRDISLDMKYSDLMYMQEDGRFRALNDISMYDMDGKRLYFDNDGKEKKGTFKPVVLAPYPQVLPEIARALKANNPKLSDYQAKKMAETMTLDKDGKPLKSSKSITLEKGKTYQWFYRRNTFDFIGRENKTLGQCCFYPEKPIKKVTILADGSKHMEGDSYKGYTVMRDAFCGEGFSLDPKDQDKLFKNADVKIKSQPMILESKLTRHKLKKIAFNYGKNQNKDYRFFYGDDLEKASNLEIVENYPVKKNGGKIYVSSFYDRELDHYQPETIIDKVQYNGFYDTQRCVDNAGEGVFHRILDDDNGNTARIKFCFNMLDCIKEERDRLCQLRCTPEDKPIEDADVMVFSVATGLDEKANLNAIHCLKSIADSSDHYCAAEPADLDTVFGNIAEYAESSVCENGIIQDHMGEGFRIDGKSIISINGEKATTDDNGVVKTKNNRISIAKDGSSYSWKDIKFDSVYSQEELLKIKSEDEEKYQKLKGLQYAEVRYRLPLTDAVVKENCVSGKDSRGKTQYNNPIKTNEWANITYNSVMEEDKNKQVKEDFPIPQNQFLAIKLSCDQFVDGSYYKDGIKVTAGERSFVFRDIGPNKKNYYYIPVKAGEKVDVAYDIGETEDQHQLRSGPYNGSEKIKNPESLEYTYIGKTAENGVVALNLKGKSKTSKTAVLEENNKAEVTLRLDSKLGKDKGGVDVVVVLDGSRSMEYDNEGKPVKNAQVDIATLTAVDKNGKATKDKDKIAYYKSSKAPNDRFNSMGYNEKTRTYSALKALYELDKIYTPGSNIRGATVMYGTTVARCEANNQAANNETTYFVGDTSVPGTATKDTEALGRWVYEHRMPFKYNNKYWMNGRNSCKGLSVDTRENVNDKYIGMVTNVIEYTNGNQENIGNNYYDGGIGTNTQEGLHAATEIFRQDLDKHPENADRKKVVILLSDGKPTNAPPIDIQELGGIDTITPELGKKYGIKALPGPYCPFEERMTLRDVKPVKTEHDLLFYENYDENTGELKDPLVDYEVQGWWNTVQKSYSGYEYIYNTASDDAIKDKLRKDGDNPNGYSYEYEELEKKRVYFKQDGTPYVAETERPVKKQLEIEHMGTIPTMEELKTQLKREGVIKEEKIFSSNKADVQTIDFVEQGAYSKEYNLPATDLYRVVNGGQLMVPIQVKAKNQGETITFNYYDLGDDLKPVDHDKDGNKSKTVNIPTDQWMTLYLRRNAFGVKVPEGPLKGKVVNPECIYLDPPEKVQRAIYPYSVGGKYYNTDIIGYIGEGWNIDAYSEEGKKLFDSNNIQIRVADPKEYTHNTMILEALLSKNKLKNVKYSYGCKPEDLLDWQCGGFELAENKWISRSPTITVESYHDTDNVDPSHSRLQLAYENTPTYRYTFYDRRRGMEFDKLDMKDEFEQKQIEAAKTPASVNHYNGGTAILFESNLYDNVLEERDRMRALRLTENENGTSRFSEDSAKTLDSVSNVQIYSIATGLNPDSEKQDVQEGIKVMKGIADTSKGDRYFNKKSQELPEIFKAIGQEIMVPTCSDPYIEDTMGPGISFKIENIVEVNGKAINFGENSDIIEGIDAEGNPMKDEFGNKIYQYVEKIQDNREILHEFKVVKDESGNDKLIWEPSHLRSYTDGEIKEILKEKGITETSKDYKKEYEKLKLKNFTELKYVVDITPKVLDCQKNLKINDGKNIGDSQEKLTVITNTEAMATYTDSSGLKKKEKFQNPQLDTNYIKAYITCDESVKDRYQGAKVQIGDEENTYDLSIGEEGYVMVPYNPGLDGNSVKVSFKDGNNRQIGGISCNDMIHMDYGVIQGEQSAEDVDDAVCTLNLPADSNGFVHLNIRNMPLPTGLRGEGPVFACVYLILVALLAASVYLRIKIKMKK